MEDNIYEVSRDEYVGFVSQINPRAKTIRQETTESSTIIKTYSATNKKLLCAREIYKESEEEHYYVFEMPPEEDRIAAKPVQKIVLESKEQVQAFFNALSQLTKERKNARDI